MDFLQDIMNFVHGSKDWVAGWAQTPYATTALFGIAFAESSFFPIPPDVLLIALATVDPAGSLWYAAICTVASVLGGCFGYWIGLKGGRPIMMKLFNQQKIAAVESYYQRYDVWAVGAAGLTPLPYKLFTISAGVFNLNFPRFLIASILSRGARFFAVAIIFYFFGAEIREFLTEHFAILTVAFFVLLFGGFWAVKHMGAKAVASGDSR